MLRSFGFEQDELIANANVIFAVRSAQVDYLSPARFNELLAVHSVVAEIKKVSLTFEQTITRGNVECCKATIRIACLDAQNLRPKAIPENLLIHFKK